MSEMSSGVHSYTRAPAFRNLHRVTEQKVTSVEISHTLFRYIADASKSQYHNRRALSDEIFRIFSGVHNGIFGESTHFFIENPHLNLIPGKPDSSVYIKTNIQDSIIRDFIQVLLSCTNNSAVNALAYSIQNLHGISTTIERKPLATENVGYQFLGSNWSAQSVTLALSRGFLRLISSSSTNDGIRKLFANYADAIDYDVDPNNVDPEIAMMMYGSDDNVNIAMEES